jgi:hypothetical protein
MNAPVSNLCPQPAALFLGYAVKQLLPAPTSFGDARITHIASVSECIAKRPPGWVHRWDFNNAGLYNTSDEALAAAHEQLQSQQLASPWRLFAYSFYPIRFDHFGGAVPIDPASIFNNAAVAALEPDFAFIGYDIVQRDAEPEPGHAQANVLGGGFACSPLSCNTLHRNFTVNRYCLLDHWDDATNAARDIALAQPEPGCYYIFGVYLRN